MKHVGDISKIMGISAAASIAFAAPLAAPAFASAAEVESTDNTIIDDAPEKGVEESLVEKYVAQTAAKASSVTVTGGTGSYTFTGNGSSGGSVTFNGEGSVTIGVTPTFEGEVVTGGEESEPESPAEDEAPATEEEASEKAEAPEAREAIEGEATEDAAEAPAAEDADDEIPEGWTPADGAREVEAPASLAKTGDESGTIAATAGGIGIAAFIAMIIAAIRRRRS